MKREQAIEIVRQQISGPRFDHTMRVAETAEKLAERHKADIEKAVTAALFHDYAKLKPISELEAIIKDNHLDERLLEFHPELWHAPAGAWLVQHEVGIENADVLNAIRYHTTGREGMSLLEKVIYVADYIEPGRQFDGLEEVRALANENIDLALKKALGNTIKFLIDKSAPVYPDTFEAYNSMVKH